MAKASCSPNVGTLTTFAVTLYRSQRIPEQVEGYRAESFGLGGFRDRSLFFFLLLLPFFRSFRKKSFYRVPAIYNRLSEPLELRIAGNFAQPSSLNTHPLLPVFTFFSERSNGDKHSRKSSRRVSYYEVFLFRIEVRKIPLQNFPSNLISPRSLFKSSRSTSIYK